MSTLRKRFRVTAVIGAVTALVLGLAGPAAAAASTFGRYTVASGATEGSITWYNRSVNVKGYVSDYNGGPTTTVVFFFWQADRLVSGPQTRTAVSERRDFNFTEEGPVGGITGVEVFLCDNDVACERKGFISRP
jgi:hypothetical protein